MRAVLAAALAAAAAAAGPPLSFTAGLSQAHANSSEQLLLDYTLSPTGTWGAVTGWWLAGDLDAITLRFYLDGAGSPDFAIDIPTANGAVFGAPGGDVTVYASRWFGKGAAQTGWFNHVPVPFNSSIKITFSTTNASAAGTVWLWARGMENPPALALAPGVMLPPTARLVVQQFKGELQPYTYLDLVTQPVGTQGVVAGVVLGLESSNLNVLEGCVHLTPSYSNAWADAQLLATGTEDFFKSAFYFNDGPYAQSDSGLLFGSGGSNGEPWHVSAYRLFGPDPLFFSDGVRIIWRVGDQTDPATGLKCTCGPERNDCAPNGNPQVTNVTALSYTYIW